MLISDLIPGHIKGKHNDLAASASLGTEKEALECYQEARHRMLSPAMWQEICGILCASFDLVDKSGTKLYRHARENDYVRINIPGPGTVAGSGYDWVEVEAIAERKDNGNILCGMTLRPVSAPFKNENNTAHFFRSEATSTFIVEKTGKQVTASYHGRNEVANLATEKAVDNIRNAVVAAGAKVGFSELQWQALIEAFLK